jgi:hypothetical protein
VYPVYRPWRRWLRWFLVYCGVVLAVAVIGLVIEAALRSGPRQPQTFSPTVPTLPMASSAQPAVTPSHAPKPATSPSPSLDGPLAVIQGRWLVNGVYLGFPHSTAGAVSAADDVVSEVFSTLDPDRAAAVMRLTADPSYANAPQQAAQGAASDRQALGIAATGPVPAGYSLLVQPVEYQTRDVTAHDATVLLLCDFTSTQPGTGTQTQVAVFPVRMRWAQADWKVASFGTSTDASLAAEPFSPQAASLGWQQLLPQETASVSDELPAQPARVPQQRGKHRSGRRGHVSVGRSVQVVRRGGGRAA